MTEQEPSNQPVFGIEKIYIKDCSLENPNAPGVFLLREEPKLDLSIDTAHEKIDEAHYDISVRATITTRFESSRKTVFICEVTQAGIFRIENMPEDDLRIILNIAGPNIVFPYLRHTVSILTSGAGFPAVNLAPFNFELYHKKKTEQAQGNGTVQ